jgi:hypothetical protein
VSESEISPTESTRRLPVPPVTDELINRCRKVLNEEAKEAVLKLLMEIYRPDRRMRNSPGAGR